MRDYISVINNFDELFRVNGELIDNIGDCPNLERPIAPETYFWKKIAAKAGYECQENIIFHSYRVVSPRRTKVANGSRNVMLEKMNRLAGEDFFLPGDVIGVSRNGLYEHYAIYLGNKRVIHYSGDSDDFGGRVSVHEAPFSEFIKDSKYCFVVWFDNGRPIKIQRETTFLFNDNSSYYNAQFQKMNGKIYSAEETIKRAKQRLGEEKYNLVRNNCEHFAMWCKTGVAKSSQVDNYIRFAMAAGTYGTGFNH